MRVDVKGLAKDVCSCEESKVGDFFANQPGYDSFYLMFNFVLPCLRNNVLRLRELDLNAFSMDDLDDLEDFIQNCYSTDRITIPVALAEMADQSSPLARHGRAFC